MKIKTSVCLMLMAMTYCAKSQTIDSTETIIFENEEGESFENFWKYGKEVGINITPLAVKFIPFNLASSNLGDQVLALKTKWYGEKRAFIINFGADLGPDDNNPQLFLSFGSEKRRNVSEKWKYTSGWEVLASTVGNPAGEVPTLGISKHFGIEYHFIDNFYLSTETRFVLGIGEDSIPRFFLVPPFSIFFNVLLN